MSTFDFRLAVGLSRGTSSGCKAGAIRNCGGGPVPRSPASSRKYLISIIYKSRFFPPWAGSSWCPPMTPKNKSLAKNNKEDLSATNYIMTTVVDDASSNGVS